VNRLLVIGYGLLGRRDRARYLFAAKFQYPITSIRWLAARLILLLSAGLSVMAQDTVSAGPVDPVVAALGAVRAGQLSEAGIQLAEISNPPAKWFVQACIEKAKGDPKRAAETIAELIVLYPNDPDWTAKSELMSAVLYLELGMLDAADVTARQIQKIYEGTGIADRATALRSRIDQLKKETEEEGSIK